MGRAGKHARPRPVTAPPFAHLNPLMHIHIHTPYHAISLLHKFVLVVSLLRAFTPHFAFAVCVAVRILPGSADYDPRQFHCCINGCIIAACIYSPFRFLCVCGCSHLPCCINLYWLCHCCLHLLPILLLLCVWLFAFYLARLIMMTPGNFIAA